MTPSFSVHRRNPGHWDIYGEKTRLFRIRGNPGEFSVIDERGRCSVVLDAFPSVSACMNFITGHLMDENIIQDPSYPSNNITFIPPRT